MTLLLGKGWIKFNESLISAFGSNDFNMIEVFIMSSEDTFEDFKFSSSVNWNWSLIKPDYIKATGKGLSTLSFILNFEELSGNSLTFDLLAWQGTTLKDRAKAEWSGATWKFTKITSTYSPNTYDRTVPPPIIENPVNDPVPDPIPPIITNPEPITIQPNGTG